MREDVFKKYYRTMVNIINYKEKDKNGNERKCTVPVSMAKQKSIKFLPVRTLMRKGNNLPMIQNL